MDELLRGLLQKAALEEGGGRSTRELAKLAHCSTQAVVDYLRTVKDEGKLIVRWRSSERVDGRSQRIPVYSRAE